MVRHAPYGLLSPFPIPPRPWCSVSLDWITDLPPSHYHDAILVVVDRLTKQALFIPTTKSMAALDVVLGPYYRMLPILELPYDI